MLTLAFVGFLGGLITGVSPCVLPMLPIIFFTGGSKQDNIDDSEGVGRSTRVDRWRPLKIIAGLVISFSVFTLVGSLLLSALGLPDDLLRWIGMAVLVLVGAGLIVPRLGHLIERPFYRLPKLNNVDSGP